jgi:hypothetical protein
MDNLGRIFSDILISDAMIKKGHPDYRSFRRGERAARIPCGGIP